MRGIAGDTWTLNCQLPSTYTEVIESRNKKLVTEGNSGKSICSSIFYGFEQKHEEENLDKSRSGSFSKSIKIASKSELTEDGGTESGLTRNNTFNTGCERENFKYSVFTNTTTGYQRNRRKSRSQIITSNSSSNCFKMNDLEDLYLQEHEKSHNNFRTLGGKNTSNLSGKIKKSSTISRITAHLICKILVKKVQLFGHLFLQNHPFEIFPMRRDD